MSADPRRVKELFGAAAAIPDPSERDALLARECGDDRELRQRLDALLHAHDHPRSALDRPLAAVAPEPDRTVDHRRGPTAVGDVIDGRYKLLERIGEGGMGEVWVADQLEPIRRRVALKMIKPGMDSRSVLARFEAERQALALMDHPNVAKVFDAGTTADGRPFFVMELVKGTPITEFCDIRKLTTKERLELFVPVCQAIQHAHQKGIIHRDLKPGNVLVALHDETPVPKVIDFGVAKAVGQQLTEKTLYTGFGALVGTPAYMAPEQATFNQLDIDTRADVYALGVLLYELLAGSPPVEPDRLKRAALDEVLRLVREEEPPRPSARLSTSQSKATIAAVRQSDPAKLSKLMKGELDWIVMKALEKDRTRRYETATGFAADVLRYLNGEPVQAVPPSAGYRLRKWVRKHRRPVAAGLLVLLSLLTGIAASTRQAVRARHAEAIAREQRREAEEQTAKAERNADSLAKLSEVYLDAAVDAEIRSAGVRLDADLLEYKSDPRVGLLRLARPLNHSVGPLPAIGPNFTGKMYGSFDEAPEFVKLRQFQAAAVITAGQEIVPLVPPAEAAERLETSPDGRWFLSHPDRGGLVLWSIPSPVRVGRLREKDERVVQFGFTPDSKTIWTQDVDSVVRFWNTDGTFRAKTPLRPERFVYPAGMTIEEVRKVAERANPVLVTDGVAVLESRTPGRGNGASYDDYNANRTERSPADFYSTGTGQFIRRPEMPQKQQRLGDWGKTPDKRWLVWSDVLGDRAVIASATDGRELARLDHPGPESFLSVTVSPTGKWIISKRHNGDGETRDRVSRNVLLWRSHDWKQVQDAAFTDAIVAVKSVPYITFITDDLLDVRGAELGGLLRIGQPGSWTPKTAPLNQAAFYNEYVVPELGGALHRFGRDLSDGNTFQRLNPPRGRKYHPDLAKLAPDGRFFENLDTATEKELPTIADGHFVPGVQGHFTPGIGRIAVRTFGGEPGAFTNLEEPYLHILPDANRLDIPPELVELWAQLVVGGELSPEGTFRPWDQPTWAAKQKELAAAKPPYPDFPFPGWAAAEPHLWHRIRACELAAGDKRDALIAEWRRLTGRTRPDPGPDPWRTKQAAPPPRAMK